MFIVLTFLFRNRLIAYTRAIVSLGVIFLLGGAYGGPEEDLLIPMLVTNFEVVQSGITRVFELKAVLKASDECAVLRVVELDASSRVATTNEFVFKIARTDTKGGLLAVQNEWHAMQYLTWKVDKMQDSHFTTVVPRRAHPTLTEVYFCEWIQVFKDGSKSLVVCMESLGETLESKIDKKDYKPEEIIYWEVSVLEMVRFFKENGIVHRDLKPNNLVLDEIGNIHVIDFGFAYFPNTEYLPVISCGTLKYISVNAYENGSNPVALDDGFSFAYFWLQTRFGLPWNNLEYPEEALEDEQRLEELEAEKNRAAEAGEEFEFDFELRFLPARILKHKENFQLKVIAMKKEYAAHIIETEGCPGALYEIIVKSLHKNILMATKDTVNYVNCRDDFAMYYNKNFPKAERKVPETISGYFMSRVSNFLN